MKKQKKFIDFNQRLDNAIADCKKKCKCGHTKIVPYSSKYDYILCSWCGGRLYFDDNKQKEYDDRVAKNDFVFKLNKCLEKRNIQKNNNDNEKEKENKTINKKKLKRKYFKSNNEYFKFCNKPTIKIYFVYFIEKTGNIAVCYGARLGRPPKNRKRNIETFKRRSSYKHYNI